MAITLTTLLSDAYNGSNVASVTTASFTPGASRKLYIAVFVVNAGGAGDLLDVAHTSNTGGLSFTRVAQTAGSATPNGCRMALFEATTGASPSSMTVTFDVDSDGSETAYPWICAFDAVGGGTVSIKTGQIATAAEQDGGTGSEAHTSGTLPSAATSGNRSVLILGRNNDATGAATTPSGWTALFSNTGDYISGAVWHRSDFTSAGPVSITDLGEAVNSSATILFELEETGGGGSDGNVAAVTATATAQAHVPRISGAPVEYVSQGAAVAGTTSITTAAYGTDWLPGDLGVCVVASNHTTESTEPTVDGFTNIGTLNGGGGSQGAGTGNRRLTFFTRELQAGDDTTPAISLSTGNVMIAAITILRKPPSSSWATAVAAFGAETTAGTSWSEAMTSDPGFAATDMLVAACAVRDTSDSSAEGFSATGATFSALTERIDLSSETGNDIALHVATATVLTGPSSANGTRTATHSTSETGVMGVLRIRSNASANGDVAAVTATATAAAGTPVVVGGTDANVAAVTATATATAPAPTISGESIVSGGGPATASMAAPAPAVSAGSVIAAIAATVTIAALAPSVSTSGDGSVTAVAATATSAAVAPAVSGSASVAAVTATATATAPAPTVSGAGTVNVEAVAATATATAVAPVVAGVQNSTTAAVAATATAAAPAPAVSGSASVTATTAAATTQAVAPTVTAIQNANIAAIVAGAVAAAVAPQVSGITGTPVTPASRTLVVPAEDRTLVVPPENRTLEA